MSAVTGTSQIGHSGATTWAARGSKWAILCPPLPLVQHDQQPVKADTQQQAPLGSTAPHSRLINIALNVRQLACDLVDEVVAQLVGQVRGANVVKVPAYAKIRGGVSEFTKPRWGSGNVNCLPLLWQPHNHLPNP
jgi:hypothetical protein